jgi:hypothetical protein
MQETGSGEVAEVEYGSVGDVSVEQGVGSAPSDAVKAGSVS